MLEVIGNGHGEPGLQDWPRIWIESRENANVHKEIDRIQREELAKTNPERLKDVTYHPKHETEFAMPFVDQLWYVFWRVWQQYWRTPDYVWNKLLLGTISALLVSFPIASQSLTNPEQIHRLLLFPSQLVHSRITERALCSFYANRYLYHYGPTGMYLLK
jgi:ATP-binding cassette subfamily G (WHITE) protein 2 (PDR)